MLANNSTRSLYFDNPFLGLASDHKESSVEFPIVPFVVIIGTVAVLTVIGNAFVCTAIYINPGLHRVTYLAILRYESEPIEHE